MKPGEYIHNHNTNVWKTSAARWAYIAEGDRVPKDQA